VADKRPGKTVAGKERETPEGLPKIPAKGRQVTVVAWLRANPDADSLTAPRY
jgi:hypothetical protein